MRLIRPVSGQSWVLSLSIPLLAGCGSRPPAVTVREATIRERTPEHVLVEVRLLLENGNRTQLTLGEMTYDVDGGGAAPATRFAGRRRAMLTLGPMSAAELVVPAVLAPDADPARLRIDGRIGWRGEGDFERALYESGLYRPRVGFSGTTAPDRAAASR